MGATPLKRTKNNKTKDENSNVGVNSNLKRRKGIVGERYLLIAHHVGDVVSFAKCVERYLYRLIPEG